MRNLLLEERSPQEDGGMQEDGLRAHWRTLIDLRSVSNKVARKAVELELHRDTLEVVALKRAVRSAAERVQQATPESTECANAGNSVVAPTNDRSHVLDKLAALRGRVTTLAETTKTPDTYTKWGWS